MELTLGLKDIIYIGVYVVSVASLVFTFRNRLSNIEDRLKTHNSTLFKKDASLNLVSTSTCKEHREKGEKVCEIHKAETAAELSKTANIAKEMFHKLEKLNINVVKIAVHMEVDVDE